MVCSEQIKIVSVRDFSNFKIQLTNLTWDYYNEFILRKFLSLPSESVELNNDESKMFSRILTVKTDFSWFEAKKHVNGMQEGI